MSQLQRIAITSSQLQQEQILLTPQQQHYLGRVLRLREGDRFIAMDGKGKWWLAQLQGEKAQILESLTVKTELPVSITLMVALPKGNGFDEVVRCCTELGVAVIAPVGKRSHFLKTSDHEYRIRVGDYRVRYEIDDESQLVQLLQCKHRKDVYRK